MADNAIGYFQVWVHRFYGLQNFSNSVTIRQWVTFFVSGLAKVEQGCFLDASPQRKDLSAKKEAVDQSIYVSCWFLARSQSKEKLFANVIRPDECQDQVKVKDGVNAILVPFLLLTTHTLKCSCCCSCHEMERREAFTLSISAYQA